MSLKRIVRIGLMTFLVMVVLFTATNLVVRSRVFHQYLLTTIIEHAQQATGGRVELGDFAFRWWGLRADFYRVAVHGAETDPQVPLFRADHLTVNLTPRSIWRRIDLEKIVVDHPVVHLLVDKQGHSNIPQNPPTPPGTANVNIFDLAIGHFVVNDGEIYYNDRQIPLVAEVRDLQAQASFDAIKIGYEGRLGYREGRVTFGDFAPLQHGFQARFNLASSGLTLSPVLFTSGSSRISAEVRLEGYTNPSVNGSYQAIVSSGELANLLKNNLLPKGQVVTQGTVHYRSDPQQPLLNSLYIEGRTYGSELVVNLPGAFVRVGPFRSEYQLSRGTLEIHNFQAELLGGHVAADATMRHLADTPESQVEGTMRGISLAAANAGLRWRPMASVGITGRLDGTVKASWRGSMQAFQIRSDATISAEAPSGPGAAGGTTFVPLDGAVHVAYESGSDVLMLRQTQLCMPHTTLRLEGTLGNRSSLGIQVQADDLHEIDILVLAIRRSIGGQIQLVPKPPELLGLGGSVSLNGRLRGPMKDPRLAGQLGGKNLRYHNTTLHSLEAELDLGSSGVALRQGQIQTGTQGRVEFDITVGLKNWSYGPENLASVQITANSLPATDVQHIVNLRYPITGILSANLSVHGSQTNPIGKGLVRLSEARAWDQPIQDLSVRFEGTGRAVHSALSVRTPAGSGSAKVDYYPNEERYDAEADFPGIHLDKLEAAHNLSVTGIVTASARGQGTLKEPQVEVTALAPKLQWQQQALDGLKARATVAGQQAIFTLESNVSGAYVQARGTVNLNSDYDATVNVDTRSVELTPILATCWPGRGQDLRGKGELHGWLKGPLKNPERLEAHIEIPILSLGYQSIEIANTSSIRIGYRGGSVELERAELKGTGTDLQLEGVVPVPADGTLRITAKGNVDLHILRLLSPSLDSSGQVNLDIGAHGTRIRPDIQGTVHIVDAAFQAAGAPLGAEKVNAEFEIQKDRIEIRSFAAETGGGRVTAQGFAIYQPTVRFNVALSTKEVRLRYPEGIRAVLNSDLTLNGTPKSALLNGQVLVDRLSFTESFNLASIVDLFTGPSSPPSEGIVENIKLDVALKSAQELGLSSSKVSIQGLADLRVRGTVAEPVILGRTNITGGELFFNERRYQVQSGVIQFINPVRTEPVVNLSVNTTVDQFNIGLIFVGPIDHLRTSYTSDPALPPVDVINLLVTGHTTQAATASSRTPQSLLAGQLAGHVSSHVGKMVGISSLTIDPQIGGNQSNPGARLAIQQRVTKNLFFTFATDVTSSQGRVVQVEYQVTPKYALSSVRNENGGYSLQVKMRKRF